jgi:hypothetical protein
MRELIEQTELEDLIRKTVFMKIGEESDNEQIAYHCADMADTIMMVIDKYISEELGSDEVKILYKSIKRDTYIKFSETISEKELGKKVDEIFSQIKNEINQYIGSELL